MVLDLFILHQLHEDVSADDTSLRTSRPERLKYLFDFMHPRARLTDLVHAYGAGAGLVTLSEDDLMANASIAIGETRSVRDEETGSQYSFASTVEKRSPGLNLRGRLSRSSSTATLLNPPGPLSSGYTSNATPSPSAFQVKISTYACEVLPPFRSSPPTPSQTQPQALRMKVLYSSLRVSFSPRRVGVGYTPCPPRGDTMLVSSGGSSLERGGAPRTTVDIPRERDEPLERSASRLVAGLKAWIDG